MWSPGPFCLSATDLKEKKSQIDAVIAVHMYGNVFDVPKLREAAPGLPVIEDCALSLGSKLGDGVRPDPWAKSVSSAFAPVNTSLSEKAARFSRRTPAFGPRPRNAPRDCRSRVRWKSYGMWQKPFCGPPFAADRFTALVGYALWEAYNRRAEFSAKSPVAMGRIFQTDLALTKKRLDSLETRIRGAEKECRVFFASFEGGALSALCHEPTGAFYNRYQFPIILLVAERYRTPRGLFARERD